MTVVNELAGSELSARTDLVHAIGSRPVFAIGDDAPDYEADVDDEEEDEEVEDEDDDDEEDEDDDLDDYDDDEED